MIVVLTGFMGSGKTTAGRALAELLQWEFVDLDEQIEQREQLSIREIFARRGEVEFRQIEHLALRKVMQSCAQPTVVALGGGTFMQSENEAVLRDAHARSVFLEVPLEELLRRCETQSQSEPQNPRPLAQDAERFRRLYEERLLSYRRAEIRIDARGKDPQEVAEEIVNILHSD
jgi:shikimate kinase